jgi:copper chaperone CopZ
MTTLIYQIDIEGMKCSSCSKRVGDSFKMKALELGITEIKQVSAQEKRAILQVDNARFNVQHVQQIIEQHGYQFKGAKQVELSELESSNCSIQ